MGGGKGGGSTPTPQYIQSPPQTITQQANTTPWSGQQPYLEQLFSAAGTQYNTPLQFYGGNVPGVPTGQTYAPFAPQTLQAMAQTEQQAATNPIPQTATDYSNAMLSGGFLSAGNPYFQNMVNIAGQSIIPSVQGQFEKSGRYGGGAMDQAVASAMANTAGTLAYQNYGDILKQMSQAAYLAPQTAQLGYLPSQQLAAVGAMQEDQTQNAINQAMQNWQFSQMEPWQRMSLLGSEIAGNYGGTSASTGTTTGGGTWWQPGLSNTAGNVMGGLSSLGGLGLLGYSMFG